MSTSPRPIEDLAAALQRCFDAAVQEGTRAVREEVRAVREDMDARFGEMREYMDTRLGEMSRYMDTRLGEMRGYMDTRLDKQDATLRMMWHQMKGNGKLPIDH